MINMHRLNYVVATAIGLFLCRGAAWAIPTQALNPHSDAAAKIAYPNPAPANPDTTNHSHVGGIGVKEISQGGIAGFMVDNAATPQWLTEAAWDNKNHRFADANSDNVNDLAGKYGHGYINPADRPRYRFDANDYGPTKFDLTIVQQRIASTWSTWDAAAKQQGQNTRTAPDGSPLSTSVVFEDVGTAAAAEILIDFIPNFETNRGAFGEWVISPTQQTAGSPALRTLALEPNPTTKLFVNDPANAFNPNADWQVSTDGGTTFGARTPDIAIGWNFTAGGPANLGQLVQYKCVKAAGCGAGVANGSVWNGNEAAFTALNLQVADSAGGALEAANTNPFFQADFLSVTLHEWGHVIGMLHSPAGVMKSDAPFTLNNLTRDIDVNNAKGAAVLYSIPVPEPAAGVLIVLSIQLLAIRRGRRS